MYEYRCYLFGSPAKNLKTGRSILTCRSENIFGTRQPPPFITIRFLVGREKRRKNRLCEATIFLFRPQKKQEKNVSSWYAADFYHSGSIWHYASGKQVEFYLICCEMGISVLRKSYRFLSLSVSPISSISVDSCKTWDSTNTAPTADKDFFRHRETERKVWSDVRRNLIN